MQNLSSTFGFRCSAKHRNASIEVCLKRLLVQATSIILLALMAPISYAAPVVWTLNDTDLLEGTLTTDGYTIIDLDIVVSPRRYGFRDPNTSEPADFEFSAHFTEVNSQGFTNGSRAFNSWSTIPLNYGSTNVAPLLVIIFDTPSLDCGCTEIPILDWIIYGSPSVTTTGSGIMYGDDHSTQSPSIVSSPVPIPAAVWLFGSGLFGLISVARRKKVA